MRAAAKPRPSPYIGCVQSHRPQKETQKVGLGDFNVKGEKNVTSRNTNKTKPHTNIKKNDK